VIRQAVDCLAVGGKCGLIGAPGPGIDVSLEVVHLLSGRTVCGITGGDAQPDDFVPQMIDLYMQGRLPFDKMIHYYPLDQINQAVEDCASGKTLKAVLRP
jgi:aryl-alcohol dehydrogenase